MRPVRSDALLDTTLGVIAVDTSSRKNAESVVSEIRRALGSFPALPVNAEVAPRAILTGWLAGDPLPDGLSLGDECELRDPTDTGAVVKVQRMDLSGDEIARHLEAGKQATRLALVLDDHVSFVLGEDLVVRKFKLLDGAVDQLESTDRDFVAAELDARFALMAGEFKRLFNVLEAAFRPREASPYTQRMRSLFRLLSPARIAPKPPALQRDTIAFVLDDGRRIDVSRVRDPRARRVKLSVDERGVRLTLPARTSLATGERFLHEHRGWLAGQLATQAGHAGDGLQRDATTALPLRGTLAPLRWQGGRATRLDRDGDSGLLFTAPASAGASAPMARPIYEAQGRADVGRWLPKYVAGLPRPPRRIVFKRTATQWGSLAPDATLSLDLSLVLARPSAFEYVLVHELCHLLHADHSRRFWRLGLLPTNPGDGRGDQRLVEQARRFGKPAGWQCSESRGAGAEGAHAHAADRLSPRIALARVTQGIPGTMQCHNFL